MPAWWLGRACSHLHGKPGWATRNLQNSNATSSEVCFLPEQIFPWVPVVHVWPLLPGFCSTVWWAHLHLPLQGSQGQSDMPSTLRSRVVLAQGLAQGRCEEWWTVHRLSGAAVTSYSKLNTTDTCSITVLEVTDPESRCHQTTNCLCCHKVSYPMCVFCVPISLSYEDASHGVASPQSTVTSS